ncbi:Actin [Hexamita inflata]|uniref:Actin n=1 Tax=Hexamita inflata TaxID=28002 RepID=A0AA86TIT7_9EUKA|nr:Actin [Hexamita inflata]CAI9973639.1 Actin [Hexamita inflata]
MKSLSLDLGSYSYKACYNQIESSYPAQYARGARSIIGQAFTALPQMLRCEVQSPFSGPYPLNFDVLTQQLTDYFSILQADPTQTGLKCTLPPFTPLQIQKEFDQKIFEMYGFSSLFRAPGLYFAQYAPDVVEFAQTNASYAIMDIGNSQQTISCFAYQNIIQSSIRRNDCGGQLLSQQLGQSLKLSEQPMLKKSTDTPILLQNIFQLLMTSQQPIHISDSSISFQKHDNSFEFVDKSNFYDLSNSFAKPDFINQLGSLQLVQNSVHNTPSVIKQSVKKVFLTGGLTKFAFATRIENDLKSEFNVQIIKGEENGILKGIENFDDEKVKVKRSEYLEQGWEVCRRRFW